MRKAWGCHRSVKQLRRIGLSSLAPRLSAVARSGRSGNAQYDSKSTERVIYFLNQLQLHRANFVIGSGILLGIGVGVGGSLYCCSPPPYQSPSLQGLRDLRSLPRTLQMILRPLNPTPLKNQTRKTTTTTTNPMRKTTCRADDWRQAQIQCWQLQGQPLALPWLVRFIRVRAKTDS